MMALFNYYWPLEIGGGDGRGIYGYKSYVMFILLFVGHIFISAILRILHKLEYVFCSFRNPCKKQAVNVSNWKIVIIVQMTIGLPVVLGIAAWTGFLNIAMIPVFGFSWYAFSMPKPLRYW
jgi:hypothetical protein